MATFSPHTVSSIFRLSLTHTHTHTHSIQVPKQVDCNMCRLSKLVLFSFFFCKDGSDRLMKRASFSCCNFLCVLLAAAYLKYGRCRLLCLPFVWHFFFIVTHTHTHTHATHIHEAYTYSFPFVDIPAFALKCCWRWVEWCNFGLSLRATCIKPQMHAHTYTHVHAHTTNTHTYTHTHTHARKQKEDDITTSQHD